MLELNRSAPLPLPLQLAQALRTTIDKGLLPAGTRLPSTRVLARSLGVTRHVVVTAFELLFAEGWLEGRPGSGTFVQTSPHSSGPLAGGQPRWARAPEPRAEDASESVLDLRLGAVTVQPLPLPVWRRAWRFASTELPPANAGPAAGLSELRSAIAAYLNRTRGLEVHPDAIIVTAGANAALRLLTDITLRPGDTAAMEEPGYVMMRHLIERHGARVLPVPVDGDGLRVDLLPEGPLLLHVTPSHQYPLGSCLSVARRHALLAWARSTEALIVENDYDGEFRYGVAPLPALAALDPERVAYVGTFSKVLSPALRVGFLVIPTALRLTAIRQLEEEGERVTWPLQRALTFLLEHGHVDRHLRRMRREYARKRSALITVLQPLPSAVRLGARPGGTHLLLEGPSADLETKANTLRSQGIEVQGLRDFYMGDATTSGLVVGFGALKDQDIAKAGKVLQEMMGTLGPPEKSS